MGAIPGVEPHPVVVVARDPAVPVLDALVCALVTGTFHGHVAEVMVGHDERSDHDSAVNCDDLFTLRRCWFADGVGSAPRSCSSSIVQWLALGLE